MSFGHSGRGVRVKACGAPVAARGACPSWWCGGVLKSLETAGARSSTDRASDYGSEGWGFESLRAHHCSFAGRWFPPPGAGGGVPGYVVCPGTSPLCGAGSFVARGVVRSLVARGGSRRSRGGDRSPHVRHRQCRACGVIHAYRLRRPLVRHWQCQVRVGTRVSATGSVRSKTGRKLTRDCQLLTSGGWR